MLQIPCTHFYRPIFHRIIQTSRRKRLIKFGILRGICTGHLIAVPRSLSESAVRGRNTLHFTYRVWAGPSHLFAPYKQVRKPAYSVEYETSVNHVKICITRRVRVAKRSMNREEEEEALRENARWHSTKNYRRINRIARMATRKKRTGDVGVASLDSSQIIRYVRGFTAECRIEFPRCVCELELLPVNFSNRNGANRQFFLAVTLVEKKEERERDIPPTPARESHARSSWVVLEHLVTKITASLLLAARAALKLKRVY